METACAGNDHRDVGRAVAVRSRTKELRRCHPVEGLNEIPQFGLLADLTLLDRLDYRACCSEEDEAQADEAAGNHVRDLPLRIVDAGRTIPGDPNEDESHRGQKKGDVVGVLTGCAARSLGVR